MVTAKTNKKKKIDMWSLEKIVAMNSQKTTFKDEQEKEVELKDLLKEIVSVKTELLALRVEIERLKLGNKK